MPPFLFHCFPAAMPETAVATEEEHAEPGAIVERSCDVRIRQQDGKSAITFIVSSENLDRHGTRIKAGGIDLDNYKRNPVVLYGHGWGPKDDVPIGRATNVYVRNDKLYADVEFDPDDEFAQEIERKVRNKYLNAASIGFRVLERTMEQRDDGSEIPVFTKTEMVEFSVVSVPSNPEALVDSRRTPAWLQRLLDRIEELETKIEEQRGQPADQDAGAAQRQADSSATDEARAEDSGEEPDDEAPAESEADSDESSSRAVPEENAVPEEEPDGESEDLMRVRLSDLAEMQRRIERERRQQAQELAKQRMGIA